MKLTRHILVVLALAACAATFAQADARPRGGKHAANVAGHAGEHQAAGAVKGRASAGRSVSRKPSAAISGRNAIGATTQPAGVGLGAAPPSTGSAPVTSAVKPNAIGVHAGTTASTPSVATGAGRIGATTNPANAVRAAPSALPAHAGGINGTGMARPGSSLGPIGGPAKVATGIAGTGMKSKK